MSVDAAVICSHLVKVYEAERGTVQALRGVDLAAARGTVTAVVGPSGSGKTSLLRILAGIDAPTAGDVLLAGQPMSGRSPRARRRLRRRHVGFVQQRPSDNLLDGAPLGAQLAAAARRRGGRPGQVAGLLADLGLTDRAHHAPHELSGGEQQRAAVARALVGRPAVIIADEPTAELDSAATADVCNLLGGIATGRDVAVIVATHDAAVMAAAEHVLLLRDGAVQLETYRGRERTVIDGTGRLQLPPEVLAWYPERRVRLEPEESTRSIRIVPDE